MTPPCLHLAAPFWNLLIPLHPPKPKKSRRRRRRRNNRSANQNSAHRSTAPVTPDERWANENSASQSATRPKSAANDRPKMRSTPVYHRQSFHSSNLPQPPVPAANENSAFQFGLERGGIPGVYKPAQTDPRQDSTASQDLAFPHLLCWCSGSMLASHARGPGFNPRAG